jgi:hypothetical protein
LSLVESKHIHVHWRQKITSATKVTAPGCIPDYEPFPFRQRKKRRKIGPFSKRFSFAMLDLRTQEGRYTRDICDGILVTRLRRPPLCPDRGRRARRVAGARHRRVARRLQRNAGSFVEATCRRVFRRRPNSSSRLG